MFRSVDSKEVSAPPVRSDPMGVSSAELRDRADFAEPVALPTRAAALVGVLAAAVYVGWSAGPAAAGGLVQPLLLVLAFAGGLLSTWSPCGYSSISLLRPDAGPNAVGRWVPTLVSHGVGYAAGAVLLGLVVGFIGWVLLPSVDYSGAPLAALGAFALAYGLHQLGLVRLPYPQRRAQVPHDVRQRWPMWKIGLVYGFGLGTNFSTYVRTPILYVIVLAGMIGGIGQAILLFLVLNFGRWLPLTVNAMPITDRQVHRWLAMTEHRARVVDGLILAFVGALFVFLVAA
jgi:hypothetical protein